MIQEIFPVAIICSSITVFCGCRQPSVVCSYLSPELGAARQENKIFVMKTSVKTELHSWGLEEGDIKK